MLEWLSISVVLNAAACRHCGRVVSNSFGPPAVGRLLYADIRCDGNESSLAGCSYGRRSTGADDGSVDLVRHCGQSRHHVAVSCQRCHAPAARARRLRRTIILHDTKPQSHEGDGGGEFRASTPLTACFLEKVGELNWGRNFVHFTNQQNTIICIAHKRLETLPLEAFWEPKMRKNAFAAGV